MTYTYDNNGNMTKDGTRTIAYDYDNMPKSVTLGSNTTTFTYDGSGARVKKTSSVETVYIGKLYECTAETCIKYIFVGGQKIAQKIAGTNDTVYYHADHLGSISVITDAAGTNIGNMQYAPFGEARLNTDDFPARHLYTAQEFDAETGLYYYNARYYNPAIGRFISADTIVPNPQNPQAFNRYSYVINNPLVYTDPSGHDFWKKLNRELKRPQNALALQMLLPAVGTYYLTQSDTGRNILAAEIIMATAIASVACAGVCEVWVIGAIDGALSGEIAGGLSAERSGGDILSGVAVGGAVGGLMGGTMGYLSDLPGSKVNWFDKALARGFANGVAAGWAGGNGDLHTMSDFGSKSFQRTLEIEILKAFAFDYMKGSGAVPDSVNEFFGNVNPTVDSIVSGGLSGLTSTPIRKSDNANSSMTNAASPSVSQRVSNAQTLLGSSLTEGTTQNNALTVNQMGY